MFRLFILFFKAAFIAHNSACGFHYIAISNTDNDTWIIKRGTLNAFWSIRYLDSIYFSLITMNTVGYGDIVPLAQREKIYVIFMVVISCGFFAYCVNTIGGIFQEMEMKE